jgi:hypothetical protein
LPPESRPTGEEEAEVLSALPVSEEDTLGRPPAPHERDEDEDDGRDIVSTFIPYRNPKALAAYYCGFFALIPGLGFVLGVVAFILGIKAVRYASAHPEAKGMAHAITGIILGVVAFLCWNPFVCLLLWFNFRYVW